MHCQSFGPISSREELERAYAAIRRELLRVNSRAGLSQLYRRADYMTTLTHEPAWERRLGRSAQRFRSLGRLEFQKTARAINRRAGQMGLDGRFPETWRGVL